jgi:hypothetical protein
METTRGRRVQMQRSAESSKVKGRSSWEKMRKHDRCTRGEPLLKEDSLARALRCHEKCRPTRTEATRPMTRGPEPTSHSAGVRVSECEEGEPPREGRIAASLHLHRKQRPSL